MNKMKKIALVTGYVVLLAIVATIIDRPEDLSVQKFYDGTAIGTLLAGVLLFSLIGLIGFFVFRRSLMAFCITAGVAAALATYQGVDNRLNSDQEKGALSDGVTPKIAAQYSDPRQRELEVLIERVGLDKVMSDLIKEAHKNLPLKMDQFDLVVGISYLPTRDVQIYRHVLTGEWDTSADKTPDGREAIFSRLEKLGVNTACSNKLIFQMLSHGLSIRNDYLDEVGIDLFTFTVDKSRCFE